MARMKSSFLPRSLCFCALLVSGCLTGCAELQFWDNTFLDFFEPFGLNSDIQIQGQGPLIIVVENLTRGAANGESSSITVNYTGNSSGAVTFGLAAVPEDERPDNEAYRATFVLDCKDVESVTINATIFRSQIIAEEVDGVFVANEDQDPETIYGATANVGSTATSFLIGDIVDAEQVQQGTTVIVGDDDSTQSVCRLERDDTGRFITESVTAVNTFAAFERGIHFECGSVLVFAVTDERKQDGSINLQDYDCDFLFTGLNSATLKRATGADIVLFKSQLSDADLAAIEGGLLELWATQGEGALTEEERETIERFEETNQQLAQDYIRDPGKSLLRTLFPYPVRYLTIGVSVPQLSQVEAVTPLIFEQAAQFGNF